MNRGEALVATLLVMAAPLGLAAHEGHDHGKKLVGTVTAVHADRNQVEIQTTKGETAGFFVDASTKFWKGSTAAALSALRPGTRVVVETKMAGKASVATVVRIGAAGKTTNGVNAGGNPHQ